jgi:hypothetical protein
MRHSEYTTLFRTIAEKHIDIQHSGESMHFARLILSADPFNKLIIEEFLNSLKSSMQFPFMLSISYDADFENNGSDHTWKVYNASYILLDLPEKGNFQDQEEKIDKMEEVGEDILGYLKNEFNANKAIATYRLDLNTIHIEKVGDICGKYYGARVDLQFMKAGNQNLKFKPEKFS